jgi:hypothetical protein
MTPKLTKLWTAERVETGEQTIRADFSNDRHYEVVILHPGDAEQVARAMFDMASMIARDPHLVPNS